MSMKPAVTTYPRGNREHGAKIRHPLPPLGLGMQMHHAVGPIVCSDASEKNNGLTILSACPSGAHVAIDGKEFVVYPFLESSVPFNKSTPLLVPNGSVVLLLGDSTFVASSAPERANAGALHIRLRQGSEFMVCDDILDSEMEHLWEKDVCATSFTAVSTIEFKDNTALLYAWNTSEKDPLICCATYDLKTHNRDTKTVRLPTARNCRFLAHLHYGTHSVFVGTNEDGVLATVSLDHDQERVGRMWTYDDEGVLHRVRGYDCFEKDDEVCMAREVCLAREVATGPECSEGNQIAGERAGEQKIAGMPRVKLITANADGLQGGPRSKKSRSFFIDDDEEATVCGRTTCSTTTQFLQPHARPPSTVSRIIRDQTCSAHCAVLYNDGVVVTYTMTDTGTLVEETSYANVATLYSYFGGHILVKLRDSRGFVINMRPSHDTQFVPYLQHTATPYPERGAAYIGMAVYLASNEACRVITQGRLFLSIAGFDAFFRSACTQQREAEENAQKLEKARTLYRKVLEENKGLYYKVNALENTHSANEAVYRKAARMTEDAKIHSAVTDAENAYLREEMVVARRDLCRQTKFFLKLTEQLQAMGEVPECMSALLRDTPIIETQQDPTNKTDTADTPARTTDPAERVELFRHHFLGAMASCSPRPGAIQIDEIYVVPSEIAAHLTHHTISGAQLGAAQQMLGAIIGFLVDRNREAHTSAREALAKNTELEKELEATRAKLSARNKHAHELGVANKRARDAEAELAAVTQLHADSIARFKAECADYAGRCDAAEQRMRMIEDTCNAKVRELQVQSSEYQGADTTSGAGAAFVREQLKTAGFTCEDATDPQDDASAIRALIKAAGCELAAAQTREKTATLKGTLARAGETAAMKTAAAREKETVELRSAAKGRNETEHALREQVAKLTHSIAAERAESEKRDASIKEINERMNAEIARRLDAEKKYNEMPNAKLQMDELRQIVTQRDAAIADLHAHIADLSAQRAASARTTPPPGFRGPLSPPRTPHPTTPMWYPMPLPDAAAYEQRIATLTRQLATLEGERDAYKSMVTTALSAKS